LVTFGQAPRRLGIEFNFTLNHFLMKKPKPEDETQGAQRCYNVLSQQWLFIALTGFVFETAVAALSQQWLFIAMCAFGLPSGFVALCEAFFSFVAGLAGYLRATSSFCSSCSRAWFKVAP